MGCDKPGTPTRAAISGVVVVQEYFFLINGPGACGSVFRQFPREPCCALPTGVATVRDFQKCSDFDSDDTRVREIPKSEANLPSDGKVGFPRNLETELGKCQGH